MTRWLRRALLCAFAAGGVLAIGTTSASADEGSVDATLTAGAEAAEAAADVGLDVALAADAEHADRAGATADVDLNVGLTPDAEPAEGGEATANAGLDVGIGLDLPDLPDVSLADVGSCACSGSDGQADGDGDADAGDGDDPATGGDGAGTIGAGGGSAGTDGDVGAGAAPDAIGGTTGGSTDQVLVADDQVAPSSGTGVQGEAADGDGSKSGDLDSVGGKDGKDGEVDGSGDGTAGGPDDGTADGMLGGLIDFTTEDGSLGLGLVEAVESLAGDGETIGAPVGPLGALSVCRTQFALAALEGLEILDLCGVGAAEEALADEVDGRLGLDVDVDGSASPAVVGGAPSANGDAVAGVELHARSTMGTGAGAGLDVGVAGTDLAGTDLAAAPCGCDGGSTPSVGVTIGVDLAAGADDDAILADGGLGVSSALGIG